jgi:hypothetical protein
MRFLKLVPWLFAIVAVVVAATLLRVERLAAAEPPAVIDRIREVQRLEVLEVTVHKKVTFAPDPAPQPTLLGDVWQYARETVAPRRGKAIVFAQARFFVDLRRLKADELVVNGDEVHVKLPEPEVEASVLPGETEIVVSNLDSAQTAALLVKARAREAAARSVTGLLRGLGFRKVIIGARVAA